MAIKNLQELVEFGIALGKLIDNAAHGVSFSQIGMLLDVVKKAGPAFQDADQALAEYKAMTDQEAFALENYIISNFQIPDEQIEAVIVQVLIFLVELRKVISALGTNS